MHRGCREMADPRRVRTALISSWTVSGGRALVPSDTTKEMPLRTYVPFLTSLLDGFVRMARAMM